MDVVSDGPDDPADESSDPSEPVDPADDLWASPTGAPEDRPLPDDVWAPGGSAAATTGDDAPSEPADDPTDDDSADRDRLDDPPSESHPSDASSDPAALTPPPAPSAPRRSPSAGRDRARMVLGVLTVAALAVAVFFGVRLVRMLVDDEANATSPPVEGPVGLMVPGVFALAEPPTGPNAAEVVAGLDSGRDDVAVDTSVGALCAAVATETPVEVSGRWERDGTEVASTSRSQLEAPGFTDCITADGDSLPEGTYQFVVVDADGNTSAPGTIVLGAAVVAQTFQNDGDEALCGLRIAPLPAGYFSWYDASSAPIAPGASVTLALADVRQAIEVVSCDGAEVVDTMQVRPDAATARSVGD